MMKKRRQKMRVGVQMKSEGANEVTWKAQSEKKGSRRTTLGESETLDVSLLCAAVTSEHISGGR
jgi:hypothetical protein